MPPFCLPSASILTLIWLSICSEMKLSDMYVPIRKTSEKHGREKGVKSEEWRVKNEEWRIACGRSEEQTLSPPTPLSPSKTRGETTEGEIACGRSEKRKVKNPFYHRWKREWRMKSEESPAAEWIMRNEEWERRVSDFLRIFNGFSSTILRIIPIELS